MRMTQFPSSQPTSASADASWVDGPPYYRIQYHPEVDRLSVLPFLPKLKVLIDKPSNASEVFEHLSSEVKEARVAPADKTLALGRQAAMVSQLRWAQTCKTLFDIPDEPPEAGPIVPDMLDEANMWDWAGVSFGRLETYRLYLSVKKVKP